MEYLVGKLCALSQEYEKLTALTGRPLFVSTCTQIWKSNAVGVAVARQVDIALFIANYAESEFWNHSVLLFFFVVLDFTGSKLQVDSGTGIIPSVIAT